MIRAYKLAFWLIPITVGLTFVAALIVPVYAPGGILPADLLTTIVIILFANLGFSLSLTRVIADCRSGKRGEAIWVAVVAALGSLLCFGVGGTAVIQAALVREMRRYGIKPTFLGIARGEFESKINELSSGDDGVADQPQRSDGN